MIKDYSNGRKKLLRFGPCSSEGRHHCQALPDSALPLSMQQGEPKLSQLECAKCTRIDKWRAPQSIFNNAGCLLSFCILRTHLNSSQNTCFFPVPLASIFRSDPCSTRLVESPYPWISAHTCQSCYLWMWRKIVEEGEKSTGGMGQS